MAKNSYWISDPEGSYALVEGADRRDWFTKVQGWTEADEPGATDQVHVVNENPEIGPGKLPYASLPFHAGRGWFAGPPPGEVPANALTAEPAAPEKTKSQAAAGGEKKE